MVFQAEDRARVKKQQADLAIQLALQGRWADAAQLNRAIIESFPTDVDAFNRLGKAMTELGQYAEAREAYMTALEIDSLNSIARKNLARLAALGDESAPRSGTQKLSPQMFIEETGKTGVTTLTRLNTEIAARLTAGDQVQLAYQNGALVVRSADGEPVGEVESKLAQRLLKFMDSGNLYVAAISALDDREVKLFIRETFQHPSQLGRLSFPGTSGESVRPYLKRRAQRPDADETYGDDGDEWEDGVEGDPADAVAHRRNRGEIDDADDGDVEEEEEE